MLHNFVVPPNLKQNNGNPDKRLPNFSELSHHEYVSTGPEPTRKPNFKKLIKITIFLCIIGWVFFRYFGYWDVEKNCYLNIYPSWMQFNNHTIIEGIKYLKEKHPDHYSELCMRVKNIDPNPMLGCGGIGGGCFSGATSRTLYIGTYPDQVILSAAVIAHETCHQKQFDTNKPMDENECYKVSNLISGRNDSPPK